MAEELDAQTRLDIYKLVISRYKDMISQKETRPVSEIRQKVSPYNEWIRKLREQLISDITPYSVEIHFLTAAGRAMDYVRQIHTCEFAFTFWMEFAEMDRLKVGTAIDKAILLAALIRSFESEDVRVLMTKRGKALVRFNHRETPYLFLSESGSLLMGEDAMKILSDDPPAYSFSDLIYENYEES